MKTVDALDDENPDNFVRITHSLNHKTMLKKDLKLQSVSALVGSVLDFLCFSSVSWRVAIPDASW